MNQKFLVVGHFDTIDSADRACEWLEDNGFIAMLRQEATGPTNAGVYALLVPGDQFEAAQRTLRDRPASEEIEAMKTLDDWEEQHPDIAERYEASDYSRRTK